MICHICGKNLENTITDLPFKIKNNSVIIIKNLPVLQCQNCTEYSIEDSIMERVDKILDKADKAAELEIFSYVAA